MPGLAQSAGNRVSREAIAFAKTRIGLSEPPTLSVATDLLHSHDECGDDGDREDPTDDETGVEARKPKLFRVILLNDHYTRFEIVALVLKAVFGLGTDRAFNVMMTAHQKGCCLIAVYTLDIAETKVDEATALAKEHGAALGFTIEPEA